MRAVNESREGLDYCNHNNKCGDFDLFVVWKIVVIFGNTQFLKSADTTNVMLGHLSCKVTLMFVRVAFDQIYIRERKKSSSGSGCELRPHCLPLGVSTCDFHLRLWLSAQQDIPERVFAWLNINSPSKQPGGGWGGVWCGGGHSQAKPGPRVPIENKPGCTFTGRRNINMRCEEPRIALSSVPLVPLQGLMIPAPPLQLLLPTPLLHTDSGRAGIKVYITAEK